MKRNDLEVVNESMAFTMALVHRAKMMTYEEGDNVEKIRELLGTAWCSMDMALCHARQIGDVGDSKKRAKTRAEHLIHFVETGARHPEDPTIDVTQKVREGWMMLTIVSGNAEDFQKRCATIQEKWPRDTHFMVASQINGRCRATLIASPTAATDIVTPEITPQEESSR